ncbi:MAG: serine/threonine-protein kinase [Byssovorax sp.]
MAHPVIDPEAKPSSVQPGDLISGKYRLMRLLGAGGMGSVWAARNELTDRDFAIKFLLPSLAQSKEALHRFFLEARACGQIKHPAVVNVYDMGQAEDGSPYLVMELLEGEGFDQRLARAGTFRPGEAAAWIAFVARGLEEAHVRGLVHRDLKPGNIFFALDDRGDVIPKILDFGVSKATAAKEGDFVKTSTGAVLGSPAYMSPEQAQGETDIDGRSDVWSLGVILYEALTGQVPFDAPNYNALMVAIITRPHKPVIEVAPGVPAEISALIDQALNKDRAQRIGTARELAERLEAAAAATQSGSFPAYTTKVPTLMPGPMGLRLGSNPAITSQGLWTDAHPTQRMSQDKPHRSTRMLVGGMVLGAALLAGGVIGLSRLQSPKVAIAGRTAAALNGSMAHLRKDLLAIKAEEEAAEKAKRDAQVVVIEPSELPNVKPSPSPGAAPGSSVAPGKPPQTPRKGGKNDPHGGVENSGI